MWTIKSFHFQQSIFIFESRAYPSSKFLDSKEMIRAHKMYFRVYKVWILLQLPSSVWSNSYQFTLTLYFIYFRKHYLNWFPKML